MQLARQDKPITLPKGNSAGVFCPTLSDPSRSQRPVLIGSEASPPQKFELRQLKPLLWCFASQKNKLAKTTFYNVLRDNIFSESENPPLEI